VPVEITIREANETDLAFIMATERLEGYDELVGRWDEQQHRTALDDGRHAYFVTEANSTPVGFAILRDWASPDRNTLIKRVAIAEPGLGIGTAFVALLADAAFTETEVHRLTIGTFPENLRARRAYERAGFTAEGVARDSVFFGGRFRDELILSLLRPEWLARRAGAGL
jgi:RimJ/RimL family protein N-acetyltransferase